ncbi:MAG: response regulator transcription factor [Bacteroidales bacterium]|nr:response regulator transcription factor [Bacteroidales bacterium]
MKSFTIVVVDDHPILLEGVINFINKLANFNIVASASDGECGLNACIELSPDIVIADIDMPVMNGVDMVKELQKHNKNTKIIFLTSHVNLDTFRQATLVDHDGFLFKEDAVNELEDCLNKVVLDEKFLSNAFENFIEQNKEHFSKLEEIDLVLAQLTKSEMRVLKQIAEGKTTAQIADALFNSMKTIENHRYNICKKMNVEGNNKLTYFAIENRLHILDY